MEARARRRVRSGKEYDHLFPRPTGNDSVIKKGAEVSDTVKFIQDKVPKTTWHTEKIAKKLKGRTLDETCSNIWHFVYEHIPYKRDEKGVEQVRSPRRAWHDRNVVGRDGKVGVDCDCYTVFISSILMNLRIPHKYRITKYPKDNGEVPAWQHIYVVVPSDRKLDYDLGNRDDYIVVDCVKNDYDDEEPYLEFKDFDATMRLDYLDGIGDEEEYIVPENVDIQDIASVHDEEDLGKIGQWLKKTAKKVGKVVRVLNRFTNPGAILLRNGFLLAMKVNFMNVAKRLRYAYLTDAQAQAMGMNMSAFAKLKKVKDKAEKIYYTAGGKKENFKKAILKGKGNKDKKVPLSGLEGFGDVYADQDEYDIIHSVNGLGELGDPATGSALAAAVSTVTAVAGALSAVKGLFKKGSKEESSMASSEDAEAQAAVNQVSPESLMNEQEDFAMEESTTIPAIAPRMAMQINPGTTSQVTTTDSGGEVTTSSSSTEPKPGFFQSTFKKTTDWVKGNPILAAGIVLGAGYLVYRGMNNKPKSGGGLSGIPGRKKRRAKKKTQNKSKTKRRVTLKPIRIK